MTNDITLAQSMYEAYCEDAQWLSYLGVRCPPWTCLTAAVQRHWEAAAAHARATLLPTTPPDTGLLPTTRPDLG